MRWGPKPEPMVGDIRNRCTFLFLPKELGGQTRWLELAAIRQEWKPVIKWSGWDTYRDCEWVDVAWSNP